MTSLQTKNKGLGSVFSNPFGAIEAYAHLVRFNSKQFSNFDAQYVT